MPEKCPIAEPWGEDVNRFGGLRTQVQNQVQILHRARLLQATDLDSGQLAQRLHAAPVPCR